MTGGPDQGITAADGLADLQFLNLNTHHNGITPDGTVVCMAWVEGSPPGCTPGTPGCTPPGVLRGYCHGTYFNNGTNVLFRGGQIHDNEGMGIHNGNPGQVIDGVEFYNHWQADILLRYGRSDNRISNNTFHGAGDRAIWGTGNRQRIDHNTFIGPKPALLDFGGSYEVRDNIFDGSQPCEGSLDPSGRCNITAASGNLCIGVSDPAICE